MAGITSTKKIKGQPHLLAYITPNEVEKLKALGGQETMTKEGIPAYPEYDNYGYSSQSDFDAGDVSKSNDPNVRNVGTFETYKGGKNIGVDNTLKAKYAKDKKAKEEAKKALDKGQFYGYGPNQTNFQKFKTWNSNKQRKANLDLNKKRTIQKLKDIEQYVDEDIYGLSGQKMAEKRGYTFDSQGNITGYDRDKATAYGYDTSKLDPGKAKLGSNIGTNIESWRDNLYDVNSTIEGRLSLLNPAFDKIRPDTQVSVLNTLGKIGDRNVLSINAPNMTNKEISDEMYRLKNLGRTPDQINFIEGGGNGGIGSGYMGYPSYEAWLAAQQTLPGDDVAEEKTFDYRFGTGQDVGRDVTLGYAANGGRIGKAFGGIMDTATGRRAYGLGSVFKSITKPFKGIAKAAGKVLKSDFGKAALMAGAGWYLGGGGNPFTAAGREAFKFSNIGGGISDLGKKLLLKPDMNWGDKGSLSMMKMLGLSAALPFIPGINEAKQDTLPDSGTRGGRLLDSQGNEVLPSGIRKEINEAYESKDPERIKAIENYYAFLPPTDQYLPYPNYAVGGRVAAQEGGLMDLGGMEKDYRAEGGFVPIGKAEKADDVPARLSVNEFVFTADAVRNAGGGDIDKGAEVMENMMKNLENGGKVSEESQGNTGAQEMFSVSERIGEVI